MFIPKFHCELNPIEHVCCRAKQYTRSNCDYSFVNLEKIIDTALDAVSVELIRKYFKKVREYHRAYREEIQMILKKYICTCMMQENNKRG